MRGAGPVTLGRYELHGEIASGGSASVHLGRLIGAGGFTRVVAIKRLFPHVAREREYVAMFLDESRLAERVQHPNVVSTLDVVEEGDEIVLVMEYVEGESLAGLVKGLRELGERMPLPIVSSIIGGALRGLHAAHEARGVDGEPLRIIHRDVSPQNVLAGVDGVSRLVDFGIAHANVRLQTTREGQFKGKVAYAAPEVLGEGSSATIASDIYASGIVLWELCAGRRAYSCDSEAQLLVHALAGRLPPLDEIAPWVDAELEEVILLSIARRPEARYASALAMAMALENAVAPAAAHEVSAFVERVAAQVLEQRRALKRAIETSQFDRTVSIPSSDPVMTAEPPLTAGERSRFGLGVGIAALALSAALVAIGATRAALPNASARPPPVTSADPASEAPLSETSVSPAPLLPAASGASKRAAATHRKTSPTVKSDRPKSNPCDPPTFIDDDGIRRVKRECFGR